MTRHEFRAYDAQGKLVLNVWTRGEAAYMVERAVLQGRLDSFEIGYVDVWSSNPHEPHVRMRAHGPYSSRPEDGLSVRQSYGG